MMMLLKGGRRRLAATLTAFLRTYTLLLLALICLVSSSPLPPTKTSILSLDYSNQKPLSPPLALVTPFIHKRNSVSVPANDTGLTVVQAATATTSTTADASQASATAIGGPSLLANGLPTSFLTWIAVAIAIGIVSSLILGRFMYIKRYTRITPRAYFLPKHGFTIPYTKFKIRGPPIIVALDSPPTYAFSMYNHRSRRRGRQGRRTVGEGISTDGARVGRRDEDDVVEGEEAVDGEEEDLPGYRVDRELPQYVTVLDQIVSERERDLGDGIRSAGLEESVGAGLRPAQEEDEVLPSVAEYELATRSNQPVVQESSTPRSITDGDDEELPESNTYPPVPTALDSRPTLSRRSTGERSERPESTRRRLQRVSEDRDSTRSTIASSSNVKIEDAKDHTASNTPREGSSSHEDITKEEDKESTGDEIEMQERRST